MAQLPGKQFNAEEHKDTFEPIPDGVYTAAIVKSLLEPTKDKKGTLLKLHFKLLAGQYKGKIVFAQLNIVNPSQKAEEIAQTQLANILRACGKKFLKDNDTQHLHGIAMQIKVIFVEGTKKFPNDKNEIKKWIKLAKTSSVNDDNDGSKASEPVTPTEPEPDPETEPSDDGSDDVAPVKASKAVGKGPWDRD